MQTSCYIHEGGFAKKLCSDRCRPISDDSNSLVEIQQWEKHKFISIHFASKSFCMYTAHCVSVNSTLSWTILVCKLQDWKPILFFCLLFFQFPIVSNWSAENIFFDGNRTVWQLDCTWVDRASSSQLQQCCHWGGIQMPVCQLLCWLTSLPCCGQTSCGWKSSPWLCGRGYYLVKGQRAKMIFHLL